MKQLIIDNNTFINSFIKVCNIENLMISNNKIYNETITIESCNCSIQNNQIENEATNLIVLKVREENKDKKFTYSYNNNNEIELEIETKENYIYEYSNTKKVK